MSRPRSLRLVHLYPAEMNIYGDHGNRHVLVRRAELYGFEVVTSAFAPGDDVGLLAEADLVLGGGGQDSHQVEVAGDLARAGALLRELAEGDVPMLVVCGLYQLFGRSFCTAEGVGLDGVGVFGAATVGGARRLIGNAAVETQWGRLQGYENHGGLTTLDAGQAPLGRVLVGSGNNGTDGTEGARSGNVIGTYLHGPVLPLNPGLADQLLRWAVARHYGDEVLTARDAEAAAQLARLDRLAERARAAVAARPR